MQYTREILVGAFLGLLAFLQPVQADLLALCLVFFLNFLIGYLADRIAFQSPFLFVKAFRAVFESTIFFSLVLTIYLLGTIKHLEMVSLRCISFVTYAVTYFYALNILRNFKILLRKNTPPYRVVAFLLYILEFAFVDKIPFLKDYLNTEIDK